MNKKNLLSVSCFSILSMATIFSCVIVYNTANAQDTNILPAAKEQAQTASSIDRRRAERPARTERSRSTRREDASTQTRPASIPVDAATQTSNDDVDGWVEDPLDSDLYIKRESTDYDEDLYPDFLDPSSTITPRSTSTPLPTSTDDEDDATEGSGSEDTDDSFSSSPTLRSTSTPWTEPTSPETSPTPSTAWTEPTSPETSPTPSTAWTEPTSPETSPTPSTAWTEPTSPETSPTPSTAWTEPTSPETSPTPSTAWTEPTSPETSPTPSTTTTSPSTTTTSPATSPTSRPTSTPLPTSPETSPTPTTSSATITTISPATPATPPTSRPTTSSPSTTSRPTASSSSTPVTRPTTDSSSQTFDSSSATPRSTPRPTPTRIRPTSSSASSSTPPPRSRGSSGWSSSSTPPPPNPTQTPTTTPSPVLETSIGLSLGALMSNNTYFLVPVYQRLHYDFFCFSCDKEKKWQFWLQEGYSRLSMVSSVNNLRLKHQANNIALGVDFTSASGFLYGLFMSYNKGNVAIKAREETAKLEDYAIGLYGKAVGLFPVSVAAGISFNEDFMKTFDYFIGTGYYGSIEHKYRGRIIRLFSEVSYPILYNENVKIEPFLDLKYSFLHIDHLNIGHAAVYNFNIFNFFHKDMTVEKTTAFDGSNLFGTLGMRVGYKLGEAHSVYGSLGFRRGFGDLTLIEEQSEQDRLLDVYKLPRNSLVVEAGINCQFSERVSLNLSYEGQFDVSRKSCKNDASIKLGVSF